MTEDGQFLSHDLDHHFIDDEEEFDSSNTSWSHRKKRGLETVVNYRIPVGMLGHEQTLHLELWPSRDFLAPGIVVERRADISAPRRSPPSFRATRCHYQGTIRGQPGSQVAISACDGLVSAFTCNKAGSHKPVWSCISTIDNVNVQIFTCLCMCWQVEMLCKSCITKGRTCFLPIQHSSMYADLIIFPPTSSLLRSSNAFSAVTMKNVNINEDIFIREGGAVA